MGNSLPMLTQFITHIQGDTIMSSEKQVAANRKNAKKSTGPKTPQGKAKVAQNATKHGLTATTDVIQGESQEEFDAFKEALLDELAPKTMIQEILADRVVSLGWRMRRARHMHNQLINAIIADRNIRSEIFRCTPFPANRDPSLTLGCALKADYSDKKTLDRFALYERRTENSFLKCVNELDRRRRKNPSSRVGLAPPCPGLSIRRVGLAPPSQSDNLCPHNERRTGNSLAHADACAPAAAEQKKQTQSTEPQNAATSMETELYNLCSHVSRAQSKPNNGPPDAPKSAPRTPYRSGTRRY